MELKELKQINNGMIPTEQPTIEEKVASGIGVEGTTGQSTLTDRKYIKNLPKFEVGKVNINPNGISSGHYNFAGRTSAASQLASGPTKIPNNLPTSSSGGNNFGKVIGGALSTAASAAAPYAGALMQNATAAVDFVGSIGSAGKFNKSADDLLQEVGSAEGNIGGVSYQTQNEINAQEVAAQTSAENKANTVGLMGKGASLGASVGSVAGPVGGLIGGAVGAIGGLVGGLFGSSKRKREMRRRVAEAQDKALRQNDFSRNGALTSVLQQNYAREYGDTESQSLYGFKEGKPAQMPSGEFVPNKMQTAWGSNGEVMVQRDGAGNVVAASQIGRGNDNKDTVPIVVDNNTEIYTNKQVEIAPGIKIRPSEYFKNTGDANGANYLTAMNIQRKKFKNGKLPGFAWGLPEWSNLLGNAAGYFTANADKAKIDAEPVSKPNTYQSNANASQALYILGQQQENPYAIMPDLYNTYAKGMYALSNNAGLSGGQRALAKLSAMNNLTANAAKLQQAAQSANIAHRQQYADAMLRYGAADAQNRMAALQHDYNAYSQAHGAKQLMSSQRQTDKMNYLLNGILGNNNLYMWRNMMDLYQQDMSSRRNDRMAKYKLNQPAVVKNPDIYNYNLGIPASSKYEQAVANNVAKYFKQPAAQSMEEKLLIPDLPMFNFSANMFKKGSVSRKAAQKGGRK